MSVADGPSPRIAPLPVEEYSDEVRELLGYSLRNDDDTSPNILTTMAHHPALLRHFGRLGGFFLNRGLIPPREREIVILRVGWNCRSAYEFGQHTLIGRRAGLTDDEIASLASVTPPAGFADHETDLVTLADEICTTNTVSDPTFARLRSRWSDSELVELVLLAGFYRMVSGFLNTMAVQLDERVPAWPSGTSTTSPG